MGIFFKETKQDNVLIIDGRKYFFIGLLIVGFLLASMEQLTKVVQDSETLLFFNFLIFIGCICGVWMGIEGIYYGYFVQNYYKKQGKKIERGFGKGIKIYLFEGWVG